MPKLSVIIITLNEEDTIQHCLNSLNEIADEIIIVDSYSTDKTKEICKSNPKVRFFQHPFEGYIEQRNYAAELAKYPYILAIDSDEALSVKLRKSIEEIKINWSHDFYSFNRLNNFCGQWIKNCGWYPDIKLRLFDKRKGRFGGINPHDKLEMTPTATSKHLKGDLLHYSYNTISEHVLQQNNFAEIKAKSLFAKGNKTYFIKIIFSPLVSFIKSYLIKLGFLEGLYGFIISINTAYYSFLTYAKLWDMNIHYKRNLHDGFTDEMKEI
jgi:glycosyltransferase involved in cell wall biosynthesis